MEVGKFKNSKEILKPSILSTVIISHKDMLLLGFCADS